MTTNSERLRILDSLIENQETFWSRNRQTLTDTLDLESENDSPNIADDLPLEMDTFSTENTGVIIDDIGRLGSSNLGI